MKQEEVHIVFKEHLSHLDERELKNIVRIYCEDVEQFTLEQLLVDVNRLKLNVPIQYVTGIEVFLDYKFKVSPAVLIPRPETEELVVWVFEDFNGSQDQLFILDVGTGSGIIPICLKLTFPSWNVQAIDLSEEALNVAEENADRLEAEIKFAQANFLNKKEWIFGKIDVLVSNPPYITFAEAEKMGESVVKHEPQMALFVDEPLIFYKALCEFSQEYLSLTGAVYVELNEFQAEETKALFQQYFSDVKLKKDLQGKYRMLRARHLLS